MKFHIYSFRCFAYALSSDYWSFLAFLGFRHFPKNRKRERFGRWTCHGSQLYSRLFSCHFHFRREFVYSCARPRKGLFTILASRSLGTLWTFSPCDLFHFQKLALWRRRLPENIRACRPLMLIYILGLWPNLPLIWPIQVYLEDFPQPAISPRIPCPLHDYSDLKYPKVKSQKPDN